MSQEEQLKKMRLEILGDEVDESRDDVFKLKLDDAEIVALNTLYPYDLTKTTIDVKNNKRLANWQTRCAIELYKKMGTANVQSYSENGLSWTRDSAYITHELSSEIEPMAGYIVASESDSNV